MKLLNYSLIISGVLYFSGNSIAQESKRKPPVQPHNEWKTNQSLYGKSYRLLDETLISSDSTILDNINIMYCESFQHEIEEITVQDTSTGLMVIVFPKSVAPERPKYHTIERKER